MRSSNRGVFVLGLIFISTITPVSSQALLTLVYEKTATGFTYTFVFNAEFYSSFYDCLCGELTVNCTAQYKNLDNPPINIMNVETVSAESDPQDMTNYYECKNEAFYNHVVCKRLNQSEISCGAEKAFTTLPRPSSSSCGNTCFGLKWFKPDNEYFSYNSVNESKGPCNQSCYEITYTTPLTTTDATTTETKTSTASSTTTLTTTKVETTETQATTSTAPSTMLSTPTTTRIRTTTTIISTQPQTTSPTEAKATTSVPVTTMTPTTVTTPVTTTETQTTTSTAPSTILSTPTTTITSTQTPTTTITSTQTPSPTEPKTTKSVPVTTMTTTTVTTTPMTTTEPQTTSQTTVKSTTAMATSTVPNTTVSPTTTTSATTVTLTSNITSTESQTLTTIMSNTTTASVTNIFDEFNQDDDDDDVPLIVGLVVGCLLLALLVAIIVIVIFRRQKMRDYKTSTESLAPEHHDSDILNDGSAESYPQNRNGDMKHAASGDLSSVEIPNNIEPPYFNYIPKSSELPMYTPLPPGPQKYRIFSTQEIPFYTIVDISNNDSSQPTEWKENTTVNDTSINGNDQGNVTLPDSSGQMTKL